MNIENLTDNEKFELLNNLNKSLGYYPILVLSIDDVRDHIFDSTSDNVPDEVLHRACAYVARKYEISYDFLESIQWASELCLENAENLN